MSACCTTFRCQNGPCVWNRTTIVRVSTGYLPTRSHRVNWLCQISTCDERSYCMDKLLLTKLVDSGMSSYQIANEVGKGQTTVRYWLKIHGLELKTSSLHKKKYTDEHLLSLVSEADSFTDLIRRICGKFNGGAYYHYKARLEKLGVTLESFRHSGKTGGGSKSSELRRVGNYPFSSRRLPRIQLHAFLQRERVPYVCENCNLDTWLGKPIRLPIHHKDGNNKHNSRENLAYLCPNCHSQEH